MEALLITAIEAALKAGNEILKIYDAPHSDLNIQFKADHSPLTIADKKSNDIIKEFLRPTSFPVLSEEDKLVDFGERRHWNTLWIIDPLDGTKEFIKRNGEFTVNIALVFENTPVLGVIYVPVKKELYYGSTTEGAFKITGITSGQDIRPETLSALSQKLPLEGNSSAYTIVASRSHMSPETEAFITDIRKEHPETTLISAGSSLKICLVAEGKAQIYPRFAPTMEWDTAAGHAIIKATGKNIYMQDGITPLRYNKENLLNPWFIVK